MRVGQNHAEATADHELMPASGERIRESERAEMRNAIAPPYGSEARHYTASFRNVSRSMSSTSGRL